MPAPTAASTTNDHLAAPVRRSRASRTGRRAIRNTTTWRASDHSTSAMPGIRQRSFPVAGSRATKRAVARAVDSDTQTYGPQSAGPNVESTGRAQRGRPVRASLATSVAARPLAGRGSRATTSGWADGPATTAGGCTPMPASRPAIVAGCVHSRRPPPARSNTDVRRRPSPRSSVTAATPAPTAGLLTTLTPLWVHATPTAPAPASPSEQPAARSDAPIARCTDITADSSRWRLCRCMTGNSWGLSRPAGRTAPVVRSARRAFDGSSAR
jgi:hypothetical protein